MKQILIINITRMGDLIQMIPLLSRLHEECGIAAIDVIVDKEFAHVAECIPDIRQVFTYDFQQLMDETRVCARDVVSMYQELSQWASPLLAIGYDRVINLTFNRRSAFLTKFFGCADERGMTTAQDGSFLVKNPWLKYFLDFQMYRHVNRFNIVDLFSLGGSGPGKFSPITLFVNPEQADWARTFLHHFGTPAHWVAVQVGASDPMKAWRPEYFGQLMAHLSQDLDVGFLLIGSQKEESAVKNAINVYQEAGGQGLICEAVGQTTIPQLVALLQQCHLMVTNDTGPMHIAVGVKTPVVNLSVGHVDFRETGPYGIGNWVVQPDIECGPCGFDKICPHHACKERIVPKEIARLCSSLLTKTSLPSFASQMRVYEGAVDEDQLGTFVLRFGREPNLTAWYGTYWRRFWFQVFAGKFSKIPFSQEAPPDWLEAKKTWEQLSPQLDRLCDESDVLLQFCRQQPVPVEKIKETQRQLKEETLAIKELVKSSYSFGPLSVAFIRETFNIEGQTLVEMAKESALAAQSFRVQARQTFQQVTQNSPELMRRELYASAIG